MRTRASVISLCRFFIFAAALTLSPFIARAGDDLKLEALLIWGTNEQKSPDPSHKPVGPKLKKKLQELPLKWTNYFEVKRIKVDVPANGTKKVVLSDRCELEVKNLGQSKIQVTHFGNGKKTGTRTQDLPKEETLILGGNAPGATSWLAVLRQTD